MHAAEEAMRCASEDAASARAVQAERQLTIGALKAKVAQWEQQKKLAVAGTLYRGAGGGARVVACAHPTAC